MMGFEKRCNCPCWRRGAWDANNAQLKIGNLNLEQFRDSGPRGCDSRTFGRKVRDRITGADHAASAGLRDCPRRRARRLAAGSRVSSVDPYPERPIPGRVTARRLNRTEYNNTIRDLLGVTIRAADEFPIDDSGYGFDNIGDVLSLSPFVDGEADVRRAGGSREFAVYGGRVPGSAESAGEDQDEAESGR